MRQGKTRQKSFVLMVKEFHKRKMEVVLQFYFPRGMDAAEIGNILRFWVLSYHVDWFSSDGGGSTGSDAGWRSGIVRDKTVALFL